MSSRIDVQLGQKHLAWWWMGGTGIAFVLMLLETMGPHAPLEAERAWQWFLPLVIPTLSLMLGALVFQARDGAAVAPVTVDRSIYLVSICLTVVYLLLVIVLLIVWPLLRLRPEEVMVQLEKTKLWLPAVQGLVGIALGAFFVSKTEKK